MFISDLSCLNLWKSLVFGFQSLVSYFQSSLGVLRSCLISLVVGSMGKDWVNLHISSTPPPFFHLLYSSPPAHPSSLISSLRLPVILSIPFFFFFHLLNFPNSISLLFLSLVFHSSILKSVLSSELKITSLVW